MQCVCTFFLIDVVVARLALVVVAMGSVLIVVVARLVSTVVTAHFVLIFLVAWMLLVLIAVARFVPLWL